MTIIIVLFMYRFTKFIECQIKFFSGISEQPKPYNSFANMTIVFVNNSYFFKPVEQYYYSFLGARVGQHFSSSIFLFHSLVWKEFIHLVHSQEFIHLVHSQEFIHLVHSLGVWCAQVFFFFFFFFNFSSAGTFFW